MDGTPEPHPAFRGSPIPVDVEPFAEPPYPRRHAGPVIVAGTAWCLAEDMARARRVVSSAPVIGIRRTAMLMRCDFLFSLDRERLQECRAAHQSCWQRDVETHSARPAAGHRAADYPYVDYWWRGVHGSGSSAWAAAKMALFMGFERIVLVGAPLDVGPYADETGAPTFDKEQNISKMRAKVLRDKWLHPFVSSMSGWTKEHLG